MLYLKRKDMTYKSKKDGWVIEALQINMSNVEEVREFAGVDFCEEGVDYVQIQHALPGHGVIHLRDGDYLVQLVKHDIVLGFYKLSAQKFESIYVKQ